VTAQTTAKCKIPVSILIPIKNEAANLPRCLASIAWADEIFVVDSQSTDGSQQIAESFGAKVFQFQFAGTYPKKKNWALSSLPFTHDWVFILDADEVMPEGAKEEFERIVNAEPGDVDDQPVGYWINRRFNFMGKWLKHAYFPNWNLRLFIRQLGSFEKLTEEDTASGDNEIHEHVVVNGKTAFLTSIIDHYAFPSVESFVEKHNRYSNWEARVALTTKASNNGQQKRVPGWRRQLRESSRHLPCRPLLRFLYVFIWQKGFLDGIEGYYFARLHAIYEFLIVAKTHELKRRIKE
jgi:glycosyltransferase involved in cell wall biosynthesis